MQTETATKDLPADVAGRHPEVVERLDRLMRAQHAASPDFPLPALDAMK